jgi:hypothetical protein
MQENIYREQTGTNVPGSIESTWKPRPEHREGRVARAIETRTAKMPSDTFLWAAVGSMIGSAVLHATGRQHLSLFVGQWAPTLLIMGLYNKLVKVAGSH